MVTAFLDSSVVIDTLRGYQPAINWLAQNRTHLGVTRILRLEIIQGALDKRGQQRALTLLNNFEHIDTTTSDIIWATDQLLRFRLSHNIDAFDCLIASASHRLQLPLYTLNLKHFVPLLGTLAQKPY